MSKNGTKSSTELTGFNRTSKNKKKGSKVAIDELSSDFSYVGE